MEAQSNDRRWPQWLWLVGLALAFSLVHVLLDYQMGLFGRTSEDVSWAQAALALLLGLLYAWWGVSFGMAMGSTWQGVGLAGLLWLSLLWAFLANGLAGVFACLPPCSGAFPYQDIAHFGNIIFGGWASYATWPALRASRTGMRWQAALVPVVLVVALFFLQSYLFFGRE